MTLPSPSPPLPPDYENCKENLSTHLISTTHFMSFNHQYMNTKPETSGNFTRPILSELTRV